MIEQPEEQYELFRRAILYRDADAWAAIHARYHPLLASWAYRGAHAYTDEWPADIADHALARAWAALTPERFAEFPTLARLLGYLRTCVKTTAIDSARAQAASERAWKKVDADEPNTPEQIVLGNLDRDTLWQTVIAAANTLSERVTLIESCVYNLPPRDIQARHPELFPDIGSVYTTKRNLFNRLQRNHDLLRLREAISAL
jgi:DNA-directed RNA polymerase specialized sigma24 family protein